MCCKIFVHFLICLCYSTRWCCSLCLKHSQIPPKVNTEPTPSTPTSLYCNLFLSMSSTLNTLYPPNKALLLPHLGCFSFFQSTFHLVTYNIIYFVGSLYSVECEFLDSKDIRASLGFINIYVTPKIMPSTK